MSARDMTAYMRKRRARFKAQGLTGEGRPRRERKGSPRLVSLDRALTNWEKASDAEFEAIEARGGSSEWDAAKQRWLDAASLAPTPLTPTTSSAAPSLSTIYRPPSAVYRPPRSAFASGGTPPGPPVYAVAAEASAAWRSNMQTMVAALAAQVDANTREISALKAEAEARRRKEAKVVEHKAIADAFFGLLGAAIAMLA
jgi:hypothetical protein